ncbi:uncharacterized protein DUF3823 [Chitinophaga skermanii]|uniref:Uncharacterized protein DUF3823 n=1 Tax=Chitinophaga skermanii TaxID=331697 RepID=A0A327QF52_9BACT|nr:DUF3823 domain-containing protein [Chitinophaga skermanii]RAJ02404.1 uncharacterized protein DUF3823 [Chitinophaga skermanii]
MKKLQHIFLAGLVAFGMMACEKDNYDGPTAGLSGRFIDAETKQLVEQDIIRGTTIELLEHGYANPSPQYLIVKNDGSYANTMLFANTYTVRPVRGNFVSVEAQEVVIKGQTTLDFTVTPYIRFTDVTIKKEGNKILASFKLKQSVINNVKKIGLYAHSDFRVGEPMRLVAAERELNAVSNPNEVYTLEINLTDNSNTLKAGRKYFFRIGALIDVGEAKLNYAPAVGIDL